MELSHQSSPPLVILQRLHRFCVLACSALRLRVRSSSGASDRPTDRGGGDALSVFCVFPSPVFARTEREEEAVWNLLENHDESNDTRLLGWNHIEVQNSSRKLHKARN